MDNWTFKDYAWSALTIAAPIGYVMAYRGNAWGYPIALAGMVGGYVSWAARAARKDDAAAAAEMRAARWRQVSTFDISTLTPDIGISTEDMTGLQGAFTGISSLNAS